MKLVPPNIGKLINGIADSFTQADLTLMLLSRFGYGLQMVAGGSLTNPEVATKLFEYFQMRNEIEQLVALVRDARPRVSQFTELADVVGLFARPDNTALQVIVRPGQGGTVGHDPRKFRADLAAREDTVCCIRVGGERMGTGTLVGPDLVLTCAHVVAGAMQADGTLVSAVVCEFDYRMAQSGYTTPPTPVKATAAIASRSHAPEDLDAQAQNLDLALLDYALLRLENDVAAQPIVDGGLARGYTAIALAPPVATANQGVLVLQHPDAQPLRIDMGAISWIGATRLRHTASTLGGSSGSPVFDGDLAFTALHHAGYDWPKAAHPVNQAIPLTLIAADIRGRGIGL